MLLDIDVRCGEAIPGHHLRFTGLRVDGCSDDPVHADYDNHYPGKPVHPMLSLTYTLTPGLASDDHPDGRDIYVTVVLTPPADAAHWPAVIMPGGEREMGVGAAVTHGAIGPFVVPDDTTSITFNVANVGITRNGVAPLDNSPQRDIGTLVVDLETDTVAWEPHQG